MDESERDHILQSQLQMTAATWSQLQKSGVSEVTPLSVDLFFVAATESEARAVASELASARGLQASVGPAEDSFNIEATLPSQHLSAALLQELTQEMCQIGFRHNAKFDGWGAMIPRRKAATKPWWRFW